MDETCKKTLLALHIVIVVHVFFFLLSQHGRCHGRGRTKHVRVDIRCNTSIFLFGDPRVKGVPDKFQLFSDTAKYMNSSIVKPPFQ